MHAHYFCHLFLDTQEICKPNTVNGALSSMRPQVCELCLRSCDNCSSVKT